MTVKMSKSKEILFLITAVLTTVVVMADMVIYPIVNTFYELFPENVGGVNFLVTGSWLVFIVATFFVPQLIKLMGEKNALLLGGVISGLSLIFGAAIESLPYMLALRCTHAVGNAIVTSTIMIVISKLYCDEGRRAKMMGYYQAFMPVFGAAMSAVAGNLAVSNWKSAYYVYLLAIPMIVLIFFIVPKDLKAGEEAVVENTGKSKKPFGKAFWSACATFFIFDLIFNLALVFVSVYIAENALGNEATAGYASSVNTASGMIGGFLLGIVYKKLKNRTAIPFYALFTLALLGLYFLPSVAMVFISCFMCGFCYTAIYTYVNTMCSVWAPERVDEGISIFSVAMSAGMFLSSYVATWLMGVFGDGSYTGTIIVYALVMVAVTVLEILMNLKKHE